MAWWLAYEELYGDMDKEYPIMSKDDITILGEDDTDTVTFTSDGVGAADTVSINFDSCMASEDTLNFGTPLPGGMGQDHISFGNTATYYVGADLGDDPYPTVGSLWETVEKPQPDLTREQTQKYGEDKAIADLKDYVSSTYSGHYTSQNNSVQTLDLIQSVGDAESFCRSNAIKYLSRYDKKGQAKRDILKALHYCLLLYYFSGQTNETPTRGYETF